MVIQLLPVSILLYIRILQIFLDNPRINTRGSLFYRPFLLPIYLRGFFPGVTCLYPQNYDNHQKSLLLQTDVYSRIKDEKKTNYLTQMIGVPELNEYNPIEMRQAFIHHIRLNLFRALYTDFLT